MAHRTVSRTPPPRQLLAIETLESLTHWKTSFKTFYKRDECYKIFFKSGTQWDPNQRSYGLQDEVDGDQRNAADLCEDLCDLLNTLAGYLPHSYLTDKIVTQTKNWDEVYQVIFDHYNVQVTSESLLDFESIHKNAEETHRQFYERLLQHAKQHLAPANAKVENLTNLAADKMTISLMNMIALQWLRKTNPALIGIVRTEYSTELRANTQLAHLVPRIATNIDSLLQRYEQGNLSNKINVPENESEMVDAAAVNKTWGRGRQPARGAFSRDGRGGALLSRRSGAEGRNGGQGRGGAGPFCPGCYYLSQQLKSNIHFRHTPGDCPRKAVAVKMFQMEDQAYFFEETNDKEDFDNIGKENNSNKAEPGEIKEHFQIQTSMNEDAEKVEGEATSSSYKPAVVNKILSFNESLSGADKDLISDSKIKMAEEEKWIKQIRNLETRKAFWINAGVRKSKSPCILAHIASSPVYATIDEGSEINCIDEAFAIKHKIYFVPTTCKATAAGSSAMALAGQTQQNIEIKIAQKKPINLHLGKMIVVKNLGAEVLVGEPGKADNEIITIPHKKLVEFTNTEKKRVRLPYSTKSSSQENSTFLCKAIRNETIYEDHSIRVQLPPGMRNETHVAISSTNPSLYPGIKPHICPVDEKGNVNIFNRARAIKLSKHEHFANINLCSNILLKDLHGGEYVHKIYDLDRTDITHLIPSEGHEAGGSSEDSQNQDYVNEVVIDPDNKLSVTWKNKFKSICRDFRDIITPRPGKYNGFYGRIDNSINFSSTPPPSIRAHLPKYSHSMLKVMAQKMDQLEEWGVLRKPEDVGIVPEFVLASMLQPKPGEQEWRLVTDFTPLNIHIKKLETVAPTIQEAKEKLAKYKYHIELDLSNYFYQGGMKIEDIQFLATPHPFKGLRVYTCEPQGLKNASEHAYERLALIYGDMCEEEKMTRMADGLYVLGDTLESLEDNFVEVLNRARLCGLTFKPKKIVITPHRTVLFGWKLVGSAWSPTSHTIAPLIKAGPPVTVKQARSWIGSYKQLTECIPGHAVLLGPLEAVLGGRASAERIEWTQDLHTAFNKCKKSLNDLNVIHIPKPNDQLHTFSDYSKSQKAVGGRLEIHRLEDGKINKLPGGHFSCRVTKHQAVWFPCEGEALAARLVLEHFSHYIRESQNKTIHHTDNQPVVQAWKRSKTGAFSASARISAFLSGVSAMNVEIIHTPGKDMKTSDYNSRNPEICQETRCQICRFAKDLQNVGDRIMKVSVADINDGKVKMPFFQRASWLKVQKNDKVHQQLSYLLENSLSPEKKKTKGDQTTIKRLHNLYKIGKLSKAADGLITVTSTDPDRGSSQAISIPSQIYPGLIQALHLKLDHPSKLQLQKLSARYFYCPGFARIIEEIVSNCTVCAALKKLPEEVFSQSTEKSESFGANFSSDVIRINNQKVFLTREKLSQFTIANLISDETRESLKTVLLEQIAQLIPESGSRVQVDCATACQALKTESEQEESIFKKLNIEIDLGRTLNKNKNPVAENAIKEFHKEHLKVNPAGGPISRLQLVLIMKNMNSRIRNRGLSSKEILLQRDQVLNTCQPVSDLELSDKQYKMRAKQHPDLFSKPSEDFHIGDLIFLKADKTKLRGREMYRVVERFNKKGEQYAKIQKSESQFRSKQYEVKLAEIFLVPGNPKQRLTLDDDDDLEKHEEDQLIKDTPAL